MSKQRKKRKKRKHVRSDSNRDANGRFKRGNVLGHRFKPGESGNPGGRPKIKLMPEAARAVLASEIPGDRHHRTFAEGIAIALATRASRGNVVVASEPADGSEAGTPPASRNSRNLQTWLSRLPPFQKHVPGELALPGRSAQALDGTRRSRHERPL